MRQVERISAMIEACGGWREHHLKLDKQTLYMMARSIAARRGLGIFDDRNKKGAWTADMWLTERRGNLAGGDACAPGQRTTTQTTTTKAGGDAPINRHASTCAPGQPAHSGSNKTGEEERKPMSDEERLRYEVTMNNVINEAEMKRVLAWVQKDMLLKMKLGLPGDPLEIPLRLMAEMREIIPQGYQARLL